MHVPQLPELGADPKQTQLLQGLKQMAVHRMFIRPFGSKWTCKVPVQWACNVLLQFAGAGGRFRVLGSRGTTPVVGGLWVPTGAEGVEVPTQSRLSVPLVQEMLASRNLHFQGRPGRFARARMRFVRCTRDGRSWVSWFLPLLCGRTVDVHQI